MDKTIIVSTDPSQSARLIACGVNPKSADFVWMQDNPPRLTLRTGIIEDGNPYILAPAWSLSKLLALLPPTITSSPYEDEDPDGEYYEYDYDLFIYPNGNLWNVSYSYTEIEEYSDDLYESSHPSLIEAVVQMIETLTSHKRKLNEI